MESYGMEGTTQVICPVEYSFPINPSKGELFYSTAIAREGLHLFNGNEWKCSAMKGDSMFFESLLSDPKACYQGIITKLPLNFVKHHNHLLYDTINERFTIRSHQAGIFQLTCQALHNAEIGKLFIIKNDEAIIGMSTSYNKPGNENTNLVVAVDEAIPGDYYEAYFLTEDDEAVVFNDYHQTKLIGMKIR